MYGGRLPIPAVKVEDMSTTNREDGKTTIVVLASEPSYSAFGNMVRKWLVCAICALAAVAMNAMWITANAYGDNSSDSSDSSSSSTFASAFQKIPFLVFHAQRSPSRLRSASGRCRSRSSPSRITGIIICTSLLILDVLLVFPKSSERYKKEQTAAVRSFDGRG